MNSKQSGEKININNIFFEDSFIDLINTLSKSILDYYHPSVALISKSSNLLSLFENNLNILISIIEKNNILYNNNNQEFNTNINNLKTIKKEFKLIAIKADENLKIFMEKSKKVFKEMKIKKNSKLEDIYNEYAHKNIKNNTDQKNNSGKGNIDIFRLSELSKKSSNSQNKKRERNQTNNKVHMANKNLNINIPFIKNLIIKMNEYDEIISKHSNEAKDGYNKLKKQLLSEINKSIIIINSSKSVERKKITKTNTIPSYNGNININNNNPFIMVNSNNNNVTMKTTNNNSYYNIIDNQNLKGLKGNTFNKNNHLENSINNNIDYNNEINILKSKLEEAHNNLEIVKRNEMNKFNRYKIDLELKMKTLENQNNELKNENSLLHKKDNLENEEKKRKEEEKQNIADNEIKKLKEEMENKKNEYELNIKKLNEEIINEKKENEQKLKQLNDKNTSLSKCLADKNREIQVLQNNNKLKLNELNKLKLLVKTNEKQLKVKKLKADQQKENSPNIIKIKDLLSNNNYENNITKSQNYSFNKDSDNTINKEMILKLESEISQLKEEKENLASNLSVLEKDINEKINKNEMLENELNDKNNKIKDENILIDELKAEKEKLISKLKEYKDIEELNLSQIKILKEHIRDMERQQNIDLDLNANGKNYKKKELQKKINELEINNTNIKKQLEMELNYNGKLKNEVKTKTEQIEGLNIVIKKLMKEKESYSFNKSNSQIKSSTNPNLKYMNRTKTDLENTKKNNKDINIDYFNDHHENKTDKSSQNKNISNKKEYKNDKKLKNSINENNSNKKQNEGILSEDIKFEISNNKNNS